MERSKGRSRNATVNALSVSARARALEHEGSTKEQPRAQAVRPRKKASEPSPWKQDPSTGQWFRAGTLTPKSVAAKRRQERPDPEDTGPESARSGRQHANQGSLGQEDRAGERSYAGSEQRLNQERATALNTDGTLQVEPLLVEEETMEALIQNDLSNIALYLEGDTAIRRNTVSLDDLSPKTPITRRTLQAGQIAPVRSLSAQQVHKLDSDLQQVEHRRRERQHSEALPAEEEQQEGRSRAYTWTAGHLICPNEDGSDGRITLEELEFLKAPLGEASFRPVLDKIVAAHEADGAAEGFSRDAVAAGLGMLGRDQLKRVKSQVELEGQACKRAGVGVPARYKLAFFDIVADLDKAMAKTQYVESDSLESLREPLGDQAYGSLVECIQQVHHRESLQHSQGRFCEYAVSEGLASLTKGQLSVVTQMVAVIKSDTSGYGRPMLAFDCIIAELEAGRLLRELVERAAEEQAKQNESVFETITVDGKVELDMLETFRQVLGPNFEQLMDRILIEEATSTSNCTDSVSAESVKTAMESFGSEEMDRMKKDITLWEKGLFYYDRDGGEANELVGSDDEDFSIAQSCRW